MSVVPKTEIHARWSIPRHAFHHRSSAGLMLELEIEQSTDYKYLHVEIP